MDSENPEVIYCADYGKYRAYCDIFDKLCFEQYYKNHLKSRTHTNNIRKKTQIKTINFFSINLLGNKYELLFRY